MSSDESWRALPERLRERGDWMLKRKNIKDAELMFDAATEIAYLRAAAHSASSRTFILKFGNNAIAVDLHEIYAVTVLATDSGVVIGADDGCWCSAMFTALIGPGKDIKFESGASRLSLEQQKARIGADREAFTQFLAMWRGYKESLK